MPFNPVNSAAAIANVVAAVDADPASTVRVQQDARLSTAIASEIERSDPLDPMHFGATGYGILDDTAALNAVYVAARNKGVAVNLRGRTYACTGRLDTVGVSTIGGGARLIFTIPASVGNAFTWGGDYSTVSDIVFELSNTTVESPMQGIFNSVSNVAGQRFMNNAIICRTKRSTGRSNIYGR